MGKGCEKPALNIMFPRMSPKICIRVTAREPRLIVLNQNFSFLFFSRLPYPDKDMYVFDLGGVRGYAPK
jgi:hypothetical protein